MFLKSDKLGEIYENDLFVAGYHFGGRILHFDLTQDRTSLLLPDGNLSDRVAEKSDSKYWGQILFGEKFFPTGITDLEVGPDGYLYVLVYDDIYGQVHFDRYGAIYKIVPRSYYDDNILEEEEVLEDFTIDIFGIDDNGNPFLAVEGEAGNTVTPSRNISYAYFFETNKGTYAVMSHYGKDSSEQTSGEDLRHHSHKVNLDNDKCIISKTDEGGSDLSETNVSIVGTNITQVNKVTAAALTVNEDGKLCIDKTFSSEP